MKLKKSILAVTVLLFTASLAAQPRLIDRKNEAEKYPDLQVTEKLQEANILLSNKRLATFWHLVAMAKHDRVKSAMEMQNPHVFEYTFRQLMYTPRNVYVRYAEDIEDLAKDDKGKIKGNFILAGFGEAKLLNEQLKEKVEEAKGRGIDAKVVNWNQRAGIELTQFEFIYTTWDFKRTPVGSTRKSLSLYFKKGGKGEKGAEGGMELDMVVVQVVHDDLLAGIRHIQCIIDPTPNDAQMDDVVIFDRYNQKPASITILGMMYNTPNFPHRKEFKQKFYVKLLDHFYRLYRMVDGYAQKDGNEYNRSVLEKLERSLDY